MTKSNSIRFNGNFLLLTDSYKVSHAQQYPKGTEIVESYFTCRKGGDNDKVVFFGLQALLMKYFEGVVVTSADIDEAKELFSTHIGQFNEDGWRHIVKEHGGKLPLEIRSVREGALVDTGEAFFIVSNTDSKCYWLTNYIETLLVQVWAPIAVATNSRHIKMSIMAALVKSGTPKEIDFKLHDFGCRGVSSMETAGINGCAHLTQFLGTDTIPALKFGRDYYSENCAGFSIPASEHSTVTSYGDTPFAEDQALRNQLKTYPTGMVAHVCDSYDIHLLIKNIIGAKGKRADGEPSTYDLIVNRKPDTVGNPGRLVVRPDSGEPAEMVLRTLNALGKVFGYSKNSKGYKVLPSCIRVIQGDGVDKVVVVQIYKMIMNNGWSADNVGFGSGGSLLQKFDRDTNRCAFKCCATRINGEWKDVYKRPIDASNKASKKGRLFLIQIGNGVNTVTREKVFDKDDNLKSQFKDAHKTIFLNGEVLSKVTLQEVRKQSKDSLEVRKWEDVEEEAHLPRTSWKGKPTHKYTMKQDQETTARQELYDRTIQEEWKEPKNNKKKGKQGFSFFREKF